MFFRDRQHFEEELVKAVESDLEKLEKGNDFRRKASTNPLVTGYRKRSYTKAGLGGDKTPKGGDITITNADGSTQTLSPKEYRKKYPKNKKD